MTTLSSDFQAHLDGRIAQLAKCLKIVRRDSTVFAFTEHDQVLTIDGIDYLPVDGISVTAVRSDTSMAVDNLEIDGALTEAAGIVAGDVRAGRFDQAMATLMEVVWSDLTIDPAILKRGPLGEVTLSPPSGFKAELRGLAQFLQNNFIETYSPDCRADLGDLRCTFDVATVTETGAVTSATDDLRSFIATITGSRTGTFFDRGLLTWTGGNNDGGAIEVLTVDLDGDGTVILWLPMAAMIQIGDTFSVVAGCGKTLAICKAKFDNVLNFRGEPYIPGIDKVVQTPNAV